MESILEGNLVTHHKRADENIHLHLGVVVKIDLPLVAVQQIKFFVRGISSLLHKFLKLAAPLRLNDQVEVAKIAREYRMFRCVMRLHCQPAKRAQKDGLLAGSGDQPIHFNIGVWLKRHEAILPINDPKGLSGIL